MSDNPKVDWTSVLMKLAMLTFLGFVCYHHYGWEGFGILAAVWLIMPGRSQ